MFNHITLCLRRVSASSHCTATLVVCLCMLNGSVARVEGNGKQVARSCLLPLCRGLHFLAVQKDEDAEDSAGLWLLQARELPKI